MAQYSGLYAVTNVTSTFRDGQFKQNVIGMRRPLQELKEESGNDTFGQLTNAQSEKPENSKEAAVAEENE